MKTKQVSFQFKYIEIKEGMHIVKPTECQLLLC